MDPVPALLLGVLLPATIAGLLLATGLGVFRRGAAPRATAAVWPLALAAGVLAGHAAIAGLPPLLPRNATERLFVTVLAVALIEAAPRLGRARGALRAVALAATLALLLRPLAAASPAPLAVRGALLLAAWLGLVWLLGHEARRLSLRGFVGVAFVTGLGASLVITFTGSALLGQLAGAVVATLGAAAVLGFWNRSLAVGPGAPGVLAAALGGLGIQAFVLSEMPLDAALLLLSAPVLAAGTACLPGALRRRAGDDFLAVAAAALPAAVAAVRTAMEFFRSPA